MARPNPAGAALVLTASLAVGAVPGAAQTVTPVMIPPYVEGLTGANAWLRTPAVVGFTCAPGRNNLKVKSCPAPITLDEGAVGPFTATGVFTQGNTELPVTVTVPADRDRPLRGVDGLAPVIQITAPADGATLTAGTLGTLDYTVDPRGPAPLVSAVPAAGSVFDVGAVGLGGVTVAATDEAGNTSSVVRTYTAVAAPPPPPPPPAPPPPPPPAPSTPAPAVPSTPAAPAPAAPLPPVLVSPSGVARTSPDGAARPSFQWTGASGATFDYQISAGGQTVLGPTSTTASSVTLGVTLEAGAYAFRVRQTTSAGTGPWSGDLPFTVSSAGATAGGPAAGQTPLRVIYPTQRAAMLRPKAGSRTSRRPLLTWKKRRGATLYNVQLYRVNGTRYRKVMSVFPRTNRVRVPHRRLARNTVYVWRVWPYLSSSKRYAKAPIGTSWFRAR